MPDAKEQVAMVLAGTIALFVIGTLVVVFVLALRGTGLPDVWDALFGLVIALVSALGGWLAGRSDLGGKSSDNGSVNTPEER